MRIKRAEIVGFGKWRQQQFTFLPHNQLIFGPNEAGKSTLYQFIQAMLFGFPKKSKRKRDYQPNDGSAYGGRLWLEHPVHGTIQIERFKNQNRGQAKVIMNGQVGEERLLQKLLYPLTPELFQQVFTFQQEQLNELKHLNEEGLQTSLLSLGLSGSQKLLLARESYFKQAQTLYKGKGSQPKLNQQLVAYQELTRKIAAKEQQEQRFQQILQTLQQTERELKNVKARIQAAKNELAKKAEQQRNYALYQELQTLTTTERAASTALVSQEKQQKLAELYQQYQYLNEEVARLVQSLAGQSETQAVAEEYQFYLREESGIQALLAQRYEMSQLQEALKWAEKSQQNTQQMLLELRQQWQWSTEQLPNIPLTIAEIQQHQEALRQQIQQVQQLQEKEQQMQQAIQKQELVLEAFEEAHPELFGEATQSSASLASKWPSVALIASAGISALLGRFLTGGARFGAFGLALALLVLAFFLIRQMSKSSATSTDAKPLWQEKLSQLDFSQTQLMTLSEEIQQAHAQQAGLQQEEQQLTAANHLGMLNTYDLWLQHQPDVARYQHLTQECVQQAQQMTTQEQVYQQQLKAMRPYAEKLGCAEQDLVTQMNQLQVFADEMEKVRFAQEYNADAYTRQTVRELKEKQQKLQKQAAPLLTEYELTSLQEVPEKLAQYQATFKQHQRKNELTAMLGDLFETPVIYETLIEEMQALGAEIEQAERHIYQLQEQQQKLRYQEQQMLVDGTLDDLYQEAANLKTALNEGAQLWAGQQLAGQLLMDLLTELSEQQLPNLLKKASHYFALLTNQHYQQVQVIDGQLVVVDSQRQTALIELSTGTRDQLVMALRFAFLSLQDTMSLCPVMIDDGWLHYDSQRKQQLAQLLQLFGEKQQVICFSSDQEMVSYYQRFNQPMIELEGV